MKTNFSNARESLESFFAQGKIFHGWLSPGFVLGVIMVDFAKELLGKCELTDAVVETKSCIPDAVQLMTCCTYGNGWMRVKGWGKMALTLYDKRKLNSIRVYVNCEEIKKYKPIEQWYMKSGHVEKTIVANEIIKAGRTILLWQKVKVEPHIKKDMIFNICTSCGESYPANECNLCPRCAGIDNYYEVE